MIPSNKCISLIETSEGIKLHPYLCPAGVPTIGYGTTHYPSGIAVTLKDNSITQKQAIDYLNHDLVVFSTAVNHMIQVPLNQNQFDALIDFTYNEGTKHLQTSTLLKLLNQKNYSGASNEFAKWIYANGEVDEGLVTRRAKEATLFRSL